MLNTATNQEAALMQTTMEGGCHCGRVRFRVTANFDRVTECNCSICTKKGFVHLIVSPGQFQLVSGNNDLTTYEFNTRTAKHTFCKYCGIHPSMCRAPIPTRSTSTCAVSTTSILLRLRQNCSMERIGRRPCKGACPGDKGPVYPRGGVSRPL